MEANFAPEMQAKLNELAALCGKPADELVQDVVTGYIAELADLRGMLDSRYEDITGGKVQLMDGEEAFHKLRKMSAATFHSRQ